MRPRRGPNPQLVKIHRSYAVEEVARLLSVHKNTVRAWALRGLPVNDCRRPHLIYGEDLARFLRAERRRRKQPCGPGQMYCLRCRAPRFPSGFSAHYVPTTATSGNLKGSCAECATMMHRGVSLERIDAVCGDVIVTYEGR